MIPRVLVFFFFFHFVHVVLEIHVLVSNLIFWKVT